MDLRGSGKAALTAQDTAPGNGAPADALKIFISYSRRDLAAADAMVAALEGHGFAVTIDRRDLPYGEEWQKELAGFIAASDTVVWLVSPDSVKSKWVNWELGEVGRLSKRLIPVKVRETPPEELPEALGRIHLLPAEGEYDATKHEADLVRALNTDRAWLKRATSLGDDAREWMANGRDRARLIRGAALSEAEAWSVRKPADAPAPSSEILELILASRAAQRRGQRITVIGSLAAAIVALTLAGTAVWFGFEAQSQAAEAERQKLVAEESERLAQRERAEAERQRTVADENAAKAREQEELANRREQVAIENETRSLAAVARAAVAEERPVDGTKTALAAWPRLQNERRPQMRRVLETMAESLPAQKERIRNDEQVGFVNDAQFSADGSRVVSAGNRGFAHVIDAKTGTLLFKLFHEESSVYSAAYSPDGTIVATAAQDAVRIWDAEYGILRRRLVGHESYVQSVRFSPSGKTILTTSWDGTARTWDVASGEQLLNVKLASDGQFASYSPTGDTFLATTSRGTIEIWNADTGTSVLKIAGHEGAVNAAAFSPDGTSVASAGEDGTVRLFDARSGLELLRLGSTTDRMESVEFSPSGEHLLTGSWDGTARIWTLKGVEVGRLTGLGQVTRAAYSSDGKAIVTASNDGSVRTWNVDVGFTNSLISPDVAFNIAMAGKRRLLAAMADESIRLIDLQDGKELLRLQNNYDLVCAYMSNDGSKIVSTDGLGIVKIWDVATGTVVREFEPYNVSSSDDDTTFCASFSPDGTKLVIGSEENEATLWDWSTGKLIHRLAGHRAKVSVARFSPDGTKIVTGSYDGRIRIWDPRRGVALVSMEVEGMVNDAVFSPDSSRLVTTQEQPGFIRIWDTRSGQEIVHSVELAFLFGSVALSPDSTRFVSAYRGAGLRVWDAATGVGLLNLVGSRTQLGPPIFSDDGQRIISATQEGIKSWDISGLEAGTAFDVACQRLGNNNSLNEVRERYGLGELTPICGDNPPLPVDWSKLQ